MRHRVLLVMLALSLGTIASVAEAAVGDIRFTTFVPSGALCGEGVFGTALALVPGGKAGFPQSPVLLVTSCVNFIGDGSEIDLFFTDPFFDTGEGTAPTVLKTLVTIFPSTATAASKPANGWEALVLRADKGDLLACGTNSGKTVLWSIDFSPFNTIADGSATFLRNGPTGSSCGSIAWDPSDSTVYQTPAPGFFSVFHSKNDGTALTSINASTACATAITGLGIAGTSLFVACAGTSGESIQAPTVTQLYKVNGSVVPGRPSFPFSCFECTVPLTLTGVPDDPATLASEFNELLWTLDDLGHFVAFEMAGGTIGQKTGVPALLPGSCPDSVGGNVSSDGDGLLDCWKNGALWSDGKPGINYAGAYSAGGNIANRDVTLCVTNPPAAFNQNTDCAQLGRKDLFLEIDYMDFHKPDINTSPLSAVDLVVQMFKNAPVDFPTGVSLHVQVDDLVSVNGKTHFTNVAFVPCTPAASPSDTTTVDFDAVKKLFFGTTAERAALATKPNALNAKALAFRYALMAHNLLGLGTTSGCAEIGGNDLVVSLGSWGSKSFTVGGKTVAHNVGTLDQLSGTLGHEFGHTVGLRHGGGDSMNCKPNYVSIMNYNLQFLSPTQRTLDYSGQALNTLDKTILNENLGLGALIPPRTITIAFGPVAPLTRPFLATTDGGPINWDPSSTDSDTTETLLSLDLSQTTSTTGGCPANQKGALPDNDSGRYYNGFNDWASLQYSFRASVDFADGGHITSGETALTEPQTDTTPAITLEVAAALSSDAIPITVDLKSGGANNNVNRNSNQDVEVAIFSGSGFDATTIAPATVLLQGVGWAVPVKQKGNGEFECEVKDVNHDRLQDLVCKFKIPKNTVGAGETSFLITGATTQGATIDDPPVSVFGTTPITVHP